MQLLQHTTILSWHHISTLENTKIHKVHKNQRNENAFYMQPPPHTTILSWQWKTWKGNRSCILKLAPHLPSRLSKRQKYRNTKIKQNKNTNNCERLGKRNRSCKLKLVKLTFPAHHWPSCAHHSKPLMIPCAFSYIETFSKPLSKVNFIQLHCFHIHGWITVGTNCMWTYINRHPLNPHPGTNTVIFIIIITIITITDASGAEGEV